MADETERQKNLDKTEQDFKKWLLKKRKGKGKGKGNTIKEDTAANYISAMKNSIAYFEKEYKGHKSVFEIKDPEEFEEIFKAVKANKGKHPSANTFKNISSGMGGYLSFLKGENPNSEGGENSGNVSSEDANQRNLIFFGAPGTGKSYLLNKRSKELLKPDGESIRVTFHPDYSYAHFVGTYKPVPEGNEITYKYIPGPFMETYVKAVENPRNKYILIIEEINRANVAAVFGDVFQLLDRTKDGESEYPVKASKDIRDYLTNDTDDSKKRKWNPADCKEIKIPKNMYIWATMNSADQGVFPMDTAFKRRWDFEYLGIDTGANEDIIQGSVPIGKDGKLVKWNFIRQFINDRLAALGINEDKQLGAFFINVEIIANALKDEKGKEAFKSTFKNKVLMYLFEDAAKHKRSEMFNVKSMRYSEICKTFDNSGLAVFKGFNDKTAGSGEQTEKTTEQSDIDKPENTDGEQHS